MQIYLGVTCALQRMFSSKSKESELTTNYSSSKNTSLPQTHKKICIVFLTKTISLEDVCPYGDVFFLVIVSISYTEILPSRECAWATGERLPNRKPISIKTISSTAHPSSSFNNVNSSRKWKWNINKKVKVKENYIGNPIPSRPLLPQHLPS